MQRCGAASHNTAREGPISTFKGYLGGDHKQSCDCSHVHGRVQETKTTPKVRQCPVRVERRVESKNVTWLALYGDYMMDNHSFYLCRPPTTLETIISTHLLSLLKERGAYHAFRSTPRALRRLSCPVCAMNGQPGQDTGCDGVVTYLPLTNAPDTRDGPIKQRREDRWCCVRVERRVDRDIGGVYGVAWC
jgi:hypothetical protein